MRPDSQIQSLGIGQSHSRCLSFFKIPPHLGSLPSGSRAGSDGCDRGIAHLRTPVTEQQSSCAASRAPRARLAPPAGLLPSEPGTHLAEQPRLRVSGIQRDLPPFLSPAARTHSTSVPAPGRGGRGSSPRGRLTGLSRSMGMKMIVALLMYDERQWNEDGSITHVRRAPGLCSPRCLVAGLVAGAWRKGHTRAGFPGSFP